MRNGEQYHGYAVREPKEQLVLREVSLNRQVHCPAPIFRSSGLMDR